MNSYKQHSTAGARIRRSVRMPIRGGELPRTLSVARLLLLFVAVLSSVATRAEGLRVQGTTEYCFYDWTGERAITRHSGSFSVDLDRSGKWNLTAWSTVNTNGYFVDVFDGTNHFTITYSTRLSKAPGSPELSEAVPVERGNHVSSVSLGPYPLDLWPPEKVVWFALASGPYLADEQCRKMPALWRNARLELLAFSFTNVIEQGSDWPYSPVKAEFFTSASAKEEQHPELLVPNSKTFLANREHDQKKVRALKPGRLAARYSVETSTNFLGARIPLKYKLEVFWPGFGVNTTNRSLAESFAGLVTNIDRIDSTVGRPGILGSLTVNDYRFHYQDSQHALSDLRYKITNHVWKEVSDTGLRAGFNSLKATVPRYHNAWGRGIKAATLLILAAGLLVLPFVIFRRK